MLRSPFENFGRFADGFSKSKSFRRLKVLREKYPRVGRKSPIPKGSGSRSKEIKELILLWSSEWLRFRYGITPLARDIQAGVKAWKTSYGSKGSTRHTTRTNGSLANALTSTVTFTSSGEKNTYARLNNELLQLKYFWVDEYSRSAFTDLGLTFHNVVAVAWELTKFSFVVDWFTNIGDLIYANIPRAFVTPRGGGSIEVRTLFNQVYCVSLEDTTPSVFTRSGGVGDSVLLYSKTLTRRAVLFNEGTGLVIRDDFRFENFNRASDALALAAQQFSQVFRYLR
jgi:hypothetical protein